jgi:hypothetical protein
MFAEVMFLDPKDMPPCVAALTDHGSEIKYQDDRSDQFGPTVWIHTWINSELDDRSFCDWIDSIAMPLGGDVTEAGLSYPEDEM